MTAAKSGQPIADAQFMKYLQTIKVKNPFFIF